MKEWNLSQIYKTEEEFNIDLKHLDEDMSMLEELKGTLHTFEGFKKYVLLDIESSKRISKLYVYASMKHDLNQKDLKNSEDYSRVYSKYNELVTKTSWIQPELLKVGEKKLLDFCKDEELRGSVFGIKKLFIMNAYIKDEIQEGLMANYNEALGIYRNLYNNLTVVDTKPKKVILSTKEEIEVHTANFRYYLGILKNQEDRKKVFEAVFSFYEAHKSTLASIYNGIMQSELAECKNRGYQSILESKLYRNQIQKDVFLTLISTAKENTAPLIRYNTLRKKYFKLNELHTYDRFLSFKESQKEYSYEASRKMVLEACKSLGEDYYQKAYKVLEDGRVSVDTCDGKRTGAYSTSTYENGPFILLNHTNRLDDAFTIAHEAGHSIHTLYANESQPYQTADYEIFVAEIASTFNEQLFLDYLLSYTKDINEKIVLLQQAIDGLIATFYRQTMFADYEYQAHQLVENQVPVTSEALCNIMIDLYQKYYQMDLIQEPYKAYVWAYIPHFFGTPFYVYQYATSFAASLAFYEKVKKEEPGALKSYLGLLQAGGSDFPVELVKKAGVDLTRKETFMAVVHRLDELLTELENLLQ